MIHTASIQVVLLLAAAWVLSHNICTAVDSSELPDNLQIDTTKNITNVFSDNSTDLVPVGDGLCPQSNVSAICDPDNLLTSDELNTIGALIIDAYEDSLFACHDAYINVLLGVYIRLHDRPQDKQEVAKMRFEWGIGQHTPCGNNGLLLYLAVSPDHRQAHVYLSPGDAMFPTLNHMILQSVEDGMKPFLRHELYGQAIQAGILDLTAYVRGDKHFGDLQQACLRDFYLSSWFFIFVIYCCGGRLILLLVHFYGRRRMEIRVVSRQTIRLEVEEKLQEIEDSVSQVPFSSRGIRAPCNMSPLAMLASLLIVSNSDQPIGVPRM